MSDLTREWLEADGLGGFASGTVAGIRTRRYHALLLTATTPPTGRVVLVNGFDAWVETPAGRFAIILAALRARRPSSRTARRASRRFDREPVAALDASRFADGTRVAQELFVPHGLAPPSRVVLAAARRERGAVTLDGAPVPLRPRLPLAAPREPGLPLRRRAASRAAASRFRPYAGVPAVVVRSQRRRYAHDPTGTGTSSTPRSGRAASTSPRTSPRPARSASTSRRGEAVWLLAARGHEAAARRGRRASVALAALRADRAQRGARRFGDRARPRGRRLPRAARRRAGRSSPAIPGSPTGAATRSSRCAACASRPAGSTRRARSCSSGRAPSRRACCRTASRTRRARPSSTRSTRRSGTSSPSTSTSKRWRRPGASLRAERGALCRRRSTRSSTGYAAGHALRHPRRRRRPARRGRARRAAHLDGREGRRPGRHAAHRQAGRGPGAVAERALDRRAFSDRAGRSCSTRGLAVVPRALLERGARAASTTSSTSTTSPGTADADASARTRSSPSAACRSRCSRASGRAASSTRSRRGSGRRSACARSRPSEPGYAPRYEGGAARARRRLPPGHRLAVAHRAVRRGVGARARRHAPRRSARRASASSLRSCAHLDEAGPRPRLRDRRRRAAAHAARLPVPGLVGRRAAAARPGGPGSRLAGLKPRAPGDIQGPAW